MKLILCADKMAWAVCYEFTIWCFINHHALSRDLFLVNIRRSCIFHVVIYMSITTCQLLHVHVIPYAMTAYKQSSRGKDIENPQEKLWPPQLQPWRCHCLERRLASWISGGEAASKCISNPNRPIIPLDKWRPKTQLFQLDDRCCRDYNIAVIA